MFMRLRGHTCDMCMHTDEHHYKRHLKTCEHIRRIYESCGEDWPIIPHDGDDRGRSRSRGSNSFESDGRSSTSDDIPMKKKDKKEQKKQVRAASRSKVVTQEEINYISSVLHPVPSEQGNITHPNNPDEIEEIEQHLKHKAQSYNDAGQKRCTSNRLTLTPDADIDFGAEMDRILDILRVSELLKRNDRNRGLRNKDLSTFKTLVAELRVQIIDDLILFKRDDLEIRMRKAAFLRYTNRASYDIMTDRYTEKDWKTGEKIRTAGSESPSSGSLAVVDEEDGDECEDFTRTKEKLTMPRPSLLNNADRRHIEKPHQRIAEDGLREEAKVIEKTRATGTASKPPPSLRIISPNVARTGQIKFRNSWGRSPKITTPTSVAIIERREHLLTKVSSKYSVPATKDMWPSVNEATSLTRAFDAYKVSSKRDTDENLVFKAPWNRYGPYVNSMTNQAVEPANSTQLPIESRKRKVKKPSPEAQRDHVGKNSNTPVAPAHAYILAGDNAANRSTGNLPHTHAVKDSLLDQPPASTDEIGAAEGDAKEDHDRSDLRVFAKGDVAMIEDQKIQKSDDKDIIYKETPHLENFPISLIEEPRSTATDNSGKVSTTKSGRHRDWMKFSSSFKLDGISNLAFTTDHPAYGTHVGCTSLDCPYENSGTPDCPYHRTYCKCIDPLEPFNYKIIVYAEMNSSYIGPFNFMRSGKLMRFFNTDPETKGKLMLMDEELYFWLKSEGQHWHIESLNTKKLEHTPVPTHMPKRLIWEVEDYLRGYDKGRMLKEIDQFKDLVDRNELIRSKLCQPAITKDYLKDLQKECERGPDDDAFCYCRDDNLGNSREEYEDEKLVDCAYSKCPIGRFHHRCVEKLGYDKVSTWYCGICERHMTVDAHKATLWAQESYYKRRD